MATPYFKKLKLASTKCAQVMVMKKGHCLNGAL